MFTMGSRFRGNDAAADRLVLAVAPTAGSRIKRFGMTIRLAGALSRTC